MAPTHERGSSLLSLIDAVRDSVLACTHNNAAALAKLLDDINALQLAAETPLDTMQRIGYQHWHVACMRVALDVGFFDALVKAGEEGLSAPVLAQQTGMDSGLLERIARALASIGICENDLNGTYKANEKTAILTQKQGISSLKVWFDLCMPTAAKMPEYLKSTGYQNPRNHEQSAFAYAHGSEFWDYLSAHPDLSATFNQFMESRRKGTPSWFEAYPVEQNLSSGFRNENSSVLLVEVGGNQGHDLVKFRDRCDAEGQRRLVLQDKADVIMGVSGSLGTIECMSHDFFTAQPIKGARAYHFRAIFHDWSDEQCRKILEQTVVAMEPGYSKILISEFILPDNNVRPFPAAMDLQMMALHGGMERSESQWRSLLNSVGLNVTGIWQNVTGGEGVIEAMVAE